MRVRLEQATHLWLVRYAALALTLVVAGTGCGGSSTAGKPTKAPDLKHMVRIPAGEFTMGRDGGDRDEAPQHRVWLDEFYMDRLEVTNGEFRRFCDSTGYLYPNNPGFDAGYFVDKPSFPVVNITWEQARNYCAWAGERLPTEAEWEKAARGTDGRLYPWGNAWGDSVANIHGEPFERTAPVGSLPRGASPYGVLDMAGNVWEWCADWYELEYYSKAPNRNPLGPVGPTPWRVVRGGGFTSPRTDAETPNRSKNDPSLAIHHLGCRCAWSRRH
jgi:formylglycine-generating enzyme